MKINYVEGDLFAAIDGLENIIIPHCCNNKHGFGAGFVVPLGRKFPIVKKLYLEWGGVDCSAWCFNPSNYNSSYSRRYSTRYQTSDQCFHNR